MSIWELIKIRCSASKGMAVQGVGFIERPTPNAQGVMAVAVISHFNLMIEEV